MRSSWHRACESEFPKFTVFAENYSNKNIFGQNRGFKKEHFHSKTFFLKVCLVTETNLVKQIQNYSRVRREQILVRVGWVCSLPINVSVMNTYAKWWKIGSIWLPDNVIETIKLYKYIFSLFWNIYKNNENLTKLIRYSPNPIQVNFL